MASFKLPDTAGDYEQHGWYLLSWDAPNRVGCCGTPNHHTRPQVPRSHPCHAQVPPTLPGRLCPCPHTIACLALSSSFICFCVHPSPFYPAQWHPCHTVSLPRRSTTLAWQHHLPHSPSHDPLSATGYEGRAQPSPADTCTFHAVVFPYLTELYFRKVRLQNIFLIHLITRMNHVINTKWPSSVAHWRSCPCLTYLTSTARNPHIFF